MGVLIEGVGGAAANALGNAMGADGLRLANPTEGGAGGMPVLSAAAKSALAGIERFQGGFAADVAPSVKPQAGAGTVPDAGSGLDQARMLVEQMQQTTRVQAQLVQFVTASSISSSLGRNLNMFLRGQ